MSGIARTYASRGISISHGSGAVLYDDAGKEYIDCMSGIGVALLGHAHPALIHAISEQVRKVVTCNSMLENETRAKFAEKVAEIAPGDLNTMFLSNSGTESVECAIKLARKHSGKTGIIAMKRGFHGKTLGSLSATWKPAYKKGFEPLVPGFKHVAFGNIEELREEIDENTTAVLLEPVQGESGVLLPPDSYLKEVRELCTEKNVLMILDEVQTFGRTGNFFAADTFGVVPEILCTAKGIGGGAPIGVTLSTEEIFNSFGMGDHTSTFGGNPLSCAAGFATIETLQNEDLIRQGAETGEYLLSKLREIQNPSIREARGIGAMSALELRFPGKEVIQGCVENGLLVLASGRNVLRFLPPLVITREQVDRIVEILKEALNESAKHGRLSSFARISRQMNKKGASK